MTVTGSTFTDNVASGFGGAIDNVDGTLTVTASSFARNESRFGGAIYSEHGTATIANCTFVDNRAPHFCDSRGGNGGAINFWVTSARITNSTFVGNSGSCGGAGTIDGLLLEMVFVGNSILLLGELGEPTCSGNVTDGGHNLAWDSTCGLSTTNTSFQPELDPAGLRDNGGPTETIALCRTVGIPAGCTGASPAIEAGDQSVCAAAPVNGVDQRGFARPGANHSACSIGAYEADLFLPVATPTSTPTITTTPTITATPTGTPTLTPTPTHTPEIAACVGDCDGNRVVEVNEVILGVNIALERQPLSACAAFANALGVVDVAQLVKGVDNALRGCGPPATLTATPTSTPIGPQAACAALSGRSIGGAQISFARLAPANPSFAEHCKVLGTIPPKLNFEVRLPTSWSGRALFIGNVGLGGSIPPPEGIEDFLFSPSIATAGYATIGTDGGHQGELDDGSWALDDEEAVNNWAYLATHRVLLAARAIIAEHYGRAPDRSYFIGASAGGRQALIEAQRWPYDFDGIVALEPGQDATALTLAANQVAQHVFATPGGRLSNGKLATLAAATLAACDDLDGIADGIISNVNACQFDPATLRCTGADTDQCLTDAQIDTVNAVHAEQTLDVALANDVSSYPGWPIGHEVAPPGPPGGWSFWINGTSAAPESSVGFVASDQELRFLITGDPTLDTLHFIPGDHPDELLTYSVLFDATDPDLSAFAASGGKLIFWNGLADYGVSPRSTIRYHEEIVRTLGQESVDDFIRFYTSPGVGHFNDGPGAGTTDFLSAITAWVETGVAPGDLVSSRFGRDSVNLLLTRPLCRYPAYPYYESGDSNDAASFRCATSIVGTGTAASCTDAALAAALVGGGSVTFNCGGPATITHTGTKMIRHDTTIDGDGVITIDGEHQGGTVFSAEPGVNFAVRNLAVINARNSAIVIQDGASLTVTESMFENNSGRFGGAILSGVGTITITRSRFAGNSAYAGAAIRNSRGTLAIANSTFSSNEAWGAGAIWASSTSLDITNCAFTANQATGDDIGRPGDAGAIYFDGSGGSLHIANSTFAGNSAHDGGAVGISSTLDTTALTVSNSTFVGNYASGHGGAVNIVGLHGTSTVVNCTFSGNVATEGGGTISSSEPSLLRNSLIAGGSSPDESCEGVIVDGGHNLDDGTSCGFSSANGSLSEIDPIPDPAGLQDNGGATPTLALCTAVGQPAGCVATSPAIEAGDPEGCGAEPVSNRDQRGFARPGIGYATCAIGAYEAGASLSGAQSQRQSDTTVGM